MPATAALSSTITVPIVLNVRIQSGARARIACPVQLTAQSCRPRKARFYLAKGKVFVHGTWRHLLSEGTAFDSFLSKVFECHAKRTCEVEMRSRRGNPMFIEFAGVAENEAQECFVTATDITARKHEQLEREELQSQLAQSRKMEAVGTLAKGIAHDFNNILAGLLGGLSLLNLELGDSDAHHSDIQEMEALVQRGANLTKQLLGFGSRGHYDVRPLDLADVVTKTSAMFARTRRDISMHVDMASDLRAVLADHSQTGPIESARQRRPGHACGRSHLPECGQHRTLRRPPDAAARNSRPIRQAQGCGYRGRDGRSNTSQNLRAPFYHQRPRAGYGAGACLSAQDHQRPFWFHRCG